MADLNSSNLKILSKLVQNGFTTEKQILNMGIGDLIRIIMKIHIIIIVYYDRNYGNRVS